MSRESLLVKNTAIFAVGNLGSKLLVLLLLPFCTYYINPSGMGYYDLLYSILEVLKPIAVLAIPESLFRWLLDKGANVRSVFASWTTMFLVLVGIFSVLYAVIWFVVGFSDALIMYLLVLTGVCYMSLQFATRGLHNNKLFALQGIVYSLVLCLSSLLYVIPLRLDYFGLLLGILTGNVVACVLMTVTQWRSLGFSFSERNREIRNQMFKYSALLLPNTICWWLVNSFGRVIVTFFLGAAANGIFAIAGRFPMALNMVSSIFQQAWTEQAVGEFDSDDRDQYFTKIFHLYSKLILSLAIVLIPFTKLFIDLFLEASYSEACNYIGLLYLGSAICSFSSFFGTSYLCGKDTKGAATTTVFGAIVNCVVGIALVIPFGINGVAIGMVVSQATIWLIRVRQSNSFFSITIDWKWIIAGVGFCLVLAIVTPFMDDFAAAIALICCVVIAVLFNREIISSIFARFKKA